MRRTVVECRAHAGGKLLATCRSAAQEAVHLVGEVLDRCIALEAVGVERVEHHIIDAGGQSLQAQGGQYKLRSLDAVDGCAQVVCEEGILARDHLVSQARERPFVAAAIELLAHNLFRRHVPDGSARGGLEALCARESGKTEVHYLHLALVVDHHVIWLDIQVKYLVLVGELQGRGDAVENGRYHVDRDVVAHYPQQLGERHAVDVFHDEVREVVLHFEIVHGHDVGVVEHCRCARFLEPGEGVGRQVVHIVECDTLLFRYGREVDDLHRHAALHARVPR